VKQSFLDPSDDRVLDKVLDIDIPGVGPLRKVFSREQLREKLLKAQEEVLQATPQALPVSPQRRRRTARKRLTERSRSVAARVLSDLGLGHAGYELGRLIPEARGSNNLVGAFRLINVAVNERLKIGRNEWNRPSADDNELTLDELDQIGDELKARIEQARKGKNG